MPPTLALTNFALLAQADKFAPTTIMLGTIPGCDQCLVGPN
jgi:hypothetical protein